MDIITIGAEVVIHIINQKSRLGVVSCWAQTHLPRMQVNLIIIGQVPLVLIKTKSMIGPEERVFHRNQSFGGASRQKVNHPSQLIKLHGINNTTPKVQKLASQIVVTGSSIQTSLVRNHRERPVKLEIETVILGNITVY